MLVKAHKEMKAGSAAKLIVDALLQRFLPLARRRIETAQAQVALDLLACPHPSHLPLQINQTSNFFCNFTFVEFKAVLSYSTRNNWVHLFTFTVIVLYIFSV